MSVATLAAAPPAQTTLLSNVEQRAFALRLTLSLVSVFLLILGAAIWLGIPDQRDISELVVGLAAVLVAVPALIAGWRSLKSPDLHGITDQLIALAVIAAWADGELATAALLPLVMTISHVLEERSLLGSQAAIGALSHLTQASARRVLGNGDIEEVESQELKAGDIVQLRAGDRIPADGVVQTGTASVDTAPITGELVPVDVEVGSQVFAGAINLDGQLLVEITRVGEETTLGRVVALMQEAELAKPPVTRLLERYAGRYMLLTLLLAAGAWFMTGSTALMLALLVASCPCALVLAAPATAIAAIAVASRHGILIKGAAFLENLASVNAVIFDKTGTVTLGQLRLVELKAEPGVDRTLFARLAASLAAASSHPVSRALADLVHSDARVTLDDIKETRGRGLTGLHDGKVVALGRPELFSDLGLAYTPPPDHDGPIAGLAYGSVFYGWALLADEPRAEAREAIAELKTLGLRRQLLVTGDRTVVANRVAAYLDIAEVRAEALPEQKLDYVLEETRAGYRPMVIGDGINDSLALKAGAVGIAMGAQGSDAALASADLVLMTNDLRRLGTCIRLSRLCRRTIYTNVAIGLGWTLIIMVCAAAGLLGASGALLAALLQNLGIVVVVANAGRLLKFQDA